MGVSTFFFWGCFDVGMTQFLQVLWTKKDEYEIENNCYSGTDLEY